MHPVQVNDIVHGRQPGQTRLSAFARALGVSEDWIKTGRQPPPWLGTPCFIAPELTDLGAHRGKAIELFAEIAQRWARQTPAEQVLQISPDGQESRYELLRCTKPEELELSHIEFLVFTRMAAHVGVKLVEYKDWLPDGYHAAVTYSLRAELTTAKSWNSTMADLLREIEAPGEILIAERHGLKARIKAVLSEYDSAVNNSTGG